MKTIVVLVCLAVCQVAFADPVDIPMECTMVTSSTVPGIPDEYKDWKWYRFVTDNFEVLSIEKSSGEAITRRVESLKTWANNRWDFEDRPYQHKCMILCVPSKEIFKLWFRQRNIAPKITKSKNMDGSDRTVYAIYIAGVDRYLTAKLPEQVGRVNLMDYEIAHQSNIRLGHWAHVGMSALNNDLATVRKMLGTEYDPGSVQRVFAPDMPVIEDSTDAYRRRAAALCLMLRKLHGGGSAFKSFVLQSAANGADNALKVYGFEDYEHLDSNYTTYVRNLSYDIDHRRTPDMGLTWFTTRAK